MQITHHFQHVLILEDLIEVNQWMKESVLSVFPHVVIETAFDLQQARRALTSRHYDLALIDLSLPDGKGLEIIDWLHEHSPQTISIVVTIFEDDAYLFEAICHGAHGYLLKDLTEDVFQQHLRQLAYGIPAFSPAMTQKMLQYVKRHETIRQCKQTELPVTLREKQVLILLAKGLQSPEIAEQLQISQHTVISYIKGIYRKLHISSRAEAALLAQQYGLIEK